MSSRSPARVLVGTFLMSTASVSKLALQFLLIPILARLLGPTIFGLMSIAMSLIMLANVIAWPLAFWIVSRWLNGFAYHVAMPYWLFPAVGAGTLAIAMLAVLGYALLVARRRPVLALRYE